MNSKNKCKYIIGTLTTVLCLTACGHTNEEKELADFSSSISSFTASIQDANQQINELDVNDANASQELLSILDGLDEKFKETGLENMAKKFFKCEGSLAPVFYLG